jgi:hypothetical protein
MIRNDSDESGEADELPFDVEAAYRIWREQRVFPTNTSILEGWDEEGPVADGGYVYQTSTGEQLWQLISAELKDVNDYSFSLLTGSWRQLERIRSVRDAALRNPRASAEYLHAIEDEDWQWTRVQASTSIAVPLLLLTSFLEWSLKQIALELVGALPKVRPPESKIDALLAHIQSRALPGLRVDMSLHALLHDMRQLRNSFAHGDWEAVDGAIREWCVGDAIRAVSALLSSMESESLKGQEEGRLDPPR